MGAPRYFVYRENRQLGPFQREELLSLLRSGEIEEEDRCSSEELEVFYRVGDILAFSEAWQDEEDRVEDRAREDARLVRDFESIPIAGETPVIKPSEEEVAQEEGEEVAVERGFLGTFFSWFVPQNSSESSEVTSKREKKEQGKKRQMQEEEPEGEGAEGYEEEDAKEVILHKRHPTIVAYPKRLFLAGFGLIGAYYGAGISDFLVIGGILISVVSLLSILVHQRFTDYIVTRKRVEIIEGYVAKSSREVRIVDIRAINVDRPGMRGLYGVGTLQFSSAGSDEVEVAFKDVWAAQELKKEIRGLQDKK